MKRLTVFALAALVFFSLGCSKFEKPSAPEVPQLGSITARVLVGNNPLAGVKVNFSGPDYRLVQTGQDGYAKVDGLSAGKYDILIEGFGDSVSFATTQKSVTLEEGGSPSVTFVGTPVVHRTSSIVGRVTASGAGLADVLVCLSGDASVYTKTDRGGYYKFEGLELGNYVVTLNLNTDLYIFPELSHSIPVVGYGEFVHNFVGELKPVIPEKGSITVEVFASGVAQAGVKVEIYNQNNASLAKSLVTGQNGTARAENLLPGTYLVRISDFGANVVFYETERIVEVGEGEDVDVAFFGEILSRIYGRVSADGFGMSHILVSLSGTTSDSVRTDQNGNYSFTVGVGEYVVSMLNPDPTAYSFATLSQSVAIMGNGVFGVNFEGTRIEPDTFIISGEVSAGGYDIPNVRVVLSGVLANTALTDAGGNYEFSGLGPGEYFVSIANPDPARYEFDSLSQSVFINSADNFKVDFVGLMKSTIAGRVTVNGAGISGTVVSTGFLSDTTDVNGNYSIAGLPNGNYTVSLANPDTSRYEFDSLSQAVYIVSYGVFKVDFVGTLKPESTSTIYGRVSAGGSGLGNVDVMATIAGVVYGQAVTNTNGEYAITGLAIGNEYIVSIANPDIARYVFNSLSQSVMVNSQGSFEANFDGTLKPVLPTRGIVTVQVLKGTDPLAGVTVHLYGQDPRTITTGQNGFAITDSLSAGAYTVRISGYGDDVTFSQTEKPITVSAGGNTPVVFSGTAVVHQTCRIHGRVTIDGSGLDHVAVQLSGDRSGGTITDAGGYYSFDGYVLVQGNYTVSITNPDTLKYEFETLSQAATLLEGGSVPVNFSGTENEIVEPIPQKAAIVGVIFEDANGNWRYDAGEYVFVGLTVSLSGPEGVKAVTTGSNGRYSFTELVKGSHDVTVVNPSPSVYRFDAERDGSVTSNITIENDDGNNFEVDFVAFHK